jgi:hypothetical protein
MFLTHSKFRGHRMIPVMIVYAKDKQIEKSLLKESHFVESFLHLISCLVISLSSCSCHSEIHTGTKIKRNGNLYHKSYTHFFTDKKPEADLLQDKILENLTTDTPRIQMTVTVVLFFLSNHLN